MPFLIVLCTEKVPKNNINYTVLKHTYSSTIPHSVEQPVTQKCQDISNVTVWPCRAQYIFYAVNFGSLTTPLKLVRRRQYVDRGAGEGKTF